MMQLILSGDIASNVRVDPSDILNTKRALNRLGVYMPDPKVGLHEFPDGWLFDAIRTMQRTHGIFVDGQIGPKSATLRLINTLLSQVGSNGSYVWKTVEDPSVRPEHAARHDEIFAWTDHPHPGEEPGCRCWAENVRTIDGIIDPPIQPVYPELILLALLPSSRIYQAWKNFFDQPNPDWTLGAFKSSNRWGNQMKNRDWTPDQISTTIKYGRTFKAPNKVNPTNTATRYEYRGRYVVQDDQTKEILQISETDFKPNTLGNKE